MPLLSLLLVFAVTFVVFFLALVWVQWKKHTRPITLEANNQEAAGISAVAGTPTEPPGGMLPQAAPRGLPRGTAGSPLEWEPVAYAGTITVRTRVKVPNLTGTPEGRRSPIQTYDAPRAAAYSAALPGRITYAAIEQTAPGHLAPEEAPPPEVEEPSFVPKELAGATWLRFNFQKTGPSTQRVSTPLGMQDPRHAIRKEVLPPRRGEIEWPRQGGRLASGTGARREADLGEAAVTEPSRLPKTGPWRPYLPDQKPRPQPRQEPIPHPHMVTATPCLRTALQVCTEIQRGGRTAVWPRPANQRRPRVSSAGERLLVLALWWIVVPAAFIFALYPSRSFVRNLQPQPPAEFFTRGEGWKPAQQAREDALARAYWTCAVQSIQYDFASNKELPLEPPPQFKMNAAGSQKNDAAARDRYWEKLREVWTKPEVWQKSAVNNPSWITDVLTYLQQVLNEYTTAIRKMT